MSVQSVHDGCWRKGTKRSERQSTELYLSTGSTEDSENPSTAGYRDELDAVTTIGRYPHERLLLEESAGFESSNDETTIGQSR